MRGIPVTPAGSDASSSAPYMTSLEIPPDLKTGLDAIKERDGVPQSEQIRGAIRLWLESKGIDVSPSKSAREAALRLGISRSLVAKRRQVSIQGCWNGRTIAAVLADFSNPALLSTASPLWTAGGQPPARHF
jgi:hypothetical protein